MHATTAGSPQSSSDTFSARGYCALCTAQCATIATVENGRVTRLDPDHDHPNGGMICIKGKAAPDLVYHPDRLNYPLRRTRPKGDPDPGWQRISWEEALKAISERVAAIRDQYGPLAVALAKGTRSGTSVGDSERWLGRFLYSLGSPNWVSTTHVCNWHRDTAFSYTFGMIQPTPDLERSRSFLLWGHNPSHTSILLAQDIVAARRRGMKLVVVDPRRIGIANRADILLQPRPGSDGSLSLALVHVLIEQSLYDEAFVREWTNGSFLLRADTGQVLTEGDLIPEGRSDRFVAWDELTEQPLIYDPATGAYEREGIRPALFGQFRVRAKDGAEIRCRPCFSVLAEMAARFAPEQSESITWVPGQKVRQAAQLLATQRPISMFMWNGVGQHTNATQTSRAIATLYALLGDIDRPGGNVVVPKTSLNNVGGKEFLPKEAAAKRIGREKKPLGPPATPGNCAAYDIFTAILEGRPYPVKALLNFGSNTIVSCGDSRRGRDALCALEFSVVTDLFMTPTAELCDYVLPAASFLEMANISPGTDHRAAGRTHLQYRSAVVAPLEERRSDSWIIFELAKRLGFSDRFWGGDIEAGFACELEPTGITLDQLKAAPGGITISRAPRYERHAETDAKGMKRGFGTPSRKVEIYSHTFAAHGLPPLPEYKEPAMSPLSRPDLAAEYPLVLTNAKFATFVHSQHRALTRLRKLSPDPTAELHPDTAARYGVKHMDWMMVESPRGAIRVRARVTESIIPGVVCCQHGWWQGCRELEMPGYSPYTSDGANASALIGSDLTDPISGSLPHRSYLCRVRPAGKQLP